MKNLFLFYWLLIRDRAWEVWIVGIATGFEGFFLYWRYRWYPLEDVDQIPSIVCFRGVVLFLATMVVTGVTLLSYKKLSVFAVLTMKVNGA